MAFPFFKKKPTDTKSPVHVPKKDTLVPVGQDQAAQPTEKKTTHAPKKTWKQFPLSSNAILKRPFLTEKAIALSAAGKYVFEVSREASKLSIRKAFFNVYGVMPTKIAVIRQDGKEVRHGRITGVRRQVKKAIITVKKGTSVDIGV